MNEHPTKWMRLVIAAITVSFALACVSSSEGRRMRQDIDALDARFAELSLANSQEREQLTDLLARAEIEIAELQIALGQAQEIVRRSSTDLGMQLDQYQTQLQEIVGRVEHLEFRFGQLQEQINLFMEDVDMRLNQR